MHIYTHTHTRTRRYNNLIAKELGLSEEQNKQLMECRYNMHADRVRLNEGRCAGRERESERE
jgi:hypothetical protein